MPSLSTNQLKLYRTVLNRHLGAFGCLGPDVTAQGSVTTDHGDTIAWTVAFDPLTREWMATVDCSLSRPFVARSKVLNSLLEDFWLELHLAEQAVKYHRDEEAEAAACAAKRAALDADIAAIHTLAMDDLLAGHAAAVCAEDAAWEHVHQWDWHPAYTGEDDPGKGHYEHCAREASRLADAYRSEVSARDTTH